MSANPNSVVARYSSIPPPQDQDDRQYDHLITEDDTPVDNIYSEKQQRLLTRPLYSSWKRPNDGKFLAMANVGIFPEDKNPAIVPDAFLSLDVEAPNDVWKKKNRSYLYSVYGKEPEVVIEVVSNLVGEELKEKLKIYARMNVRYYVVWDPRQLLHKGELHAFVLRGKKYEALKKLWFPEVGLGLEIWEGAFEGMTARWLRWRDERGAVIPTGTERADREKTRATSEKQRAESEKQRADRLAAQLRALGVEPE
ncbi:MAG: Uma2 family endonuclease [Planctomycetes bacterium]|nr:Uma2 family endonuclease [Planctomycetota bacterium]